MVLDTVNDLAHEAAKRPVFTLLSSILLGGIFLLYRDFLKTYVKRPSHFLPKHFFSHFKTPKFDAPLVEMKPGETHREVLQRGSALVGF